MLDQKESGRPHNHNMRATQPNSTGKIPQHSRRCQPNAFLARDTHAMIVSFRQFWAATRPRYKTIQLACIFDTIVARLVARLWTTGWPIEADHVTHYIRRRRAQGVNLKLLNMELSTLRCVIEETTNAPQSR